MTTENIRTITIEDFKLDPHLIQYVDENIVILDNMDITLGSSTLLKIDCYLMVFCLEGEVKTNINNKEHLLKADHCVILLPNFIIRNVQNKGKCNLRIIAFSPLLIREITRIQKETWEIGFYLYDNPIFPINRNSSYKLYLYKELTLLYINEKKRHSYSKEAEKHLLSAIFCELSAALYQAIPSQEDTPNYRNDRSMYIFCRFMEKVTADDGSHRTVSYYADQLCYSPKHLSTVVKKISGRAPLSIINEHAIKCIKFQLRHSNMSMKEIADYFDFVNPSFFGKFVKTHIGMSPMQYRISEEKKEQQQ